MPLKRKGEAWADGIRAQIKAECGLGWTLRNHVQRGVVTGNTQLTHRNSDGQRNSVMLPIPFDKANGSKLVNRVVAIHAAMLQDPTKSLAEAAVANTDVLDAPQPKSGKATGWKAIQTKFVATKAGQRENSMKAWQTRTDRVIECLDFKPKPRTGVGVLERYVELHALGPNGEQSGDNCPMPAGKAGRKRNLADAAAFLKFAVERCGMDQRYLPPGADRMRELVGVADTPTAQSTPLKPEQFTALLDALAEAERWDLQLAVGLVGYLGLRPAELATLTVDGQGVAWVGAVKRNANTMTKAVPPRVVAPVEVEGRVVDPAQPENGEGSAFVTKFASGTVKLPKALREQISRVVDPKHPRHTNSFQGVGREFRQQLERFPFYASMVKKYPTLSPYALRHGFAWRATFGANRLPLRAAAALMGHDVKTHMRHYGSWIDQESTLEAVEKFNAGQRAKTRS